VPLEPIESKAFPSGAMAQIYRPACKAPLPVAEGPYEIVHDFKNIVPPLRASADCIARAAVN
jgi:hypothetical protein